MARTYHTDVIAFAALCDAKWVDNLLSRFSIPGISGGRQGVARRASTDGVYHVALIRALAQQAGIPVALAVQSAVQLLSTGDDTSSVAFGSDHIRLVLDAPAFRTQIDRRIDEAAESLVPSRRGRPPRRPG